MCENWDFLMSSNNYNNHSSGLAKIMNRQHFFSLYFQMCLNLKFLWFQHFECI